MSYHMLTADLRAYCLKCTNDLIQFKYGLERNSPYRYLPKIQPPLSITTLTTTAISPPNPNKALYFLLACSICSVAYTFFKETHKLNIKYKTI